MLTVAALPATGLVVSVYVVQQRALGRLPEIPAAYKPRVVVEWDRYGTMEGKVHGQLPSAVSLIVFSDYQCDHCATVAATLVELTQRYPNGVRITWRSYPILGTESIRSAVAATCARHVGQFEEVHKHLFSSGGRVGGTDLRELMAATGGKDVVEFKACISADSSLASVREDIELGQELGIRVVPTLLVDSLLFQGSPGPRYLQAYVRESMRKTRAAVMLRSRPRS